MAQDDPSSAALQICCTNLDRLTQPVDKKFSPLDLATSPMEVEVIRGDVVNRDGGW